jgi:dihydropteridine reductase
MLENRVREYAGSIQRMVRMNLDPVVASGFAAQHLMGPNGLLVVMGATAALQPTPGMMGYGLAKSASHHVVKTLGASTSKNLESKATRQAGKRTRSQLPASVDTLTVVGILPTMIDTPANRRALLADAADADAVVSQWTKTRDIAAEIGTWMERPDLRPHSGSLVKVRPASGPAGTGQGKAAGAVFELVR